MMETEPGPMHNPPTGPAARPPKGILKNSFSHSPPRQGSISATSPLSQATTTTISGPEAPDHDVSDRDLTLQNTLQNAGHRRSSSAGRPSGSRRQSSYNPGGNAEHEDENGMRLKWDEANLYLTEQEKSSTMKIDEPKTPYAKRYDPAEDEAEMRTLQADDLIVDEVEKARLLASLKSRGAREDDIPGLSLGEPEEAVPGLEGGEKMSREGSTKSEKAVHVNDDHQDNVGLSAEEREKHRRFEEMRKKHYEMKNVVNLLGHPSEDEDDDEDEEMNGAAS